VRRIATPPTTQAFVGGVHPLPQRPSPPVQTKLATTGPAELVTCDQTIERGFNRRKQLRAVATRYDKLECRYQATLTVASILDWLRAKPDRDPGTRLCASG
jgi:hypothetical protein